MNKRKETIQSVSFGIMVVTLMSKTLGFLREVIFSYFYGTSSVADAYIFSLTISTIIFGFIGTGLMTSFIPVYTTVKEKNGINRANELVSNIISVYIVLCLVIIAIAFSNTREIVNLLAGGFDPNTARISAYLCKFSIFTVLATGIVSILSSLLQINKMFLLPAAVGLPLNIILILSIFLSKKYGYILLGIGNLLAVYAEILILLPAVKKTRYKFKFAPNIKDEYILLIISMALPIILSASVNQVNVLIDKSLASHILGGVSILNYSHTIISIVTDVVITAFVTAIYPKITSAFVLGAQDEIKKIFSETLGSLMFVLIPATVFAVFESDDIIRFFFKRGAFSDESVAISANVLRYYAIGIPFIGIRQLLIRFFYANKDTKTPVINATIAIVFNIILNYPLLKFVGLGGLALATSLSAIVADILLWMSMNKTIKLKILHQDILDLIKVLIGAVILVLLIITISDLIRFNIYIRLLSIFIAVIVVYLVYSYFFNVSCVKQFLKGKKK